jgi:predicted transglutaminase-like protease
LNEESIKTKLGKLERFLNYKIACWEGHCPTLDETQNDEIKNLASRLKGSSHQETLTNILEWQERNFTFWTERHPLREFFLFFVLTISLIGLIGFYIVIVLSYILDTNLTIWFVSLILTTSLTGITLILLVILQIIHSNRKIPIFNALKNAFANSISIKFLLENKLGVCRDFAKLTACLLVNIYPNAEIYFANAPSHIATGIIIENRLYMLDQRLPILTINKWNKYRHLKGKLGKLGKNSIELINSKPFLSKIIDEILDTQKLANTVTELLNIKEQTDNERTLTVKIRRKKGTILYQDDEMVNYSLSRWLKAKMSTELIDLSQVGKIEASIEKEDIIFTIHLMLKLLNAEVIAEPKCR